MKYRRIVGNKLIALGYRIHGPFDAVPVEARIELKEALGLPKDAVVEVTDVVQNWSPHQHGNVIIAEPTLVALDRKGKL